MNAFNDIVLTYAVREPLKNVASEGQTRRNPTKKHSLRAVNEHFEENFNAPWPSAVVIQRLLRGLCCVPGPPKANRW